MELDPSSTSTPAHPTTQSPPFKGNTVRSGPRSPVKPDNQMRLLLQQLEIQVAYGRDKERKIERLIEENNRLGEEGADLAVEVEKLAKEVADARQNGMEKQEEEKQQGEDDMEMKQLMMAIKMQSQGMSALAGLSQIAINSIPCFAYEKTGDSEICLSCFTELENNVNVACLPCCHLFHDKCVKEHLTQSRFCPACSEEVIVL